MSPFMKGALGFLGCAGVCTVAYQIGKRVGRDEALDEVEREEKRYSKPAVVDQAPKQEAVIVEEEPIVVDATPQQPTAVERVREKKFHGLKNKIFGGAGVIKDLLGNPDGKKLVVTVEDGDVVARISQKEDK